MIIIMIMTWVGKLGTASHSFCSSNRKEEGSRSGRIDIAWERIIITDLFVRGLNYNDQLVISPHLTELDEAGPEPGEHLPQLHRVLPLQPLVLSDLPPGVVGCYIIVCEADL